MPVQWAMCKLANVRLYRLVRFFVPLRVANIVKLCFLFRKSLTTRVQDNGQKQRQSSPVTFRVVSGLHSVAM